MLLSQQLMAVIEGTCTGGISKEPLMKITAVLGGFSMEIYTLFDWLELQFFESFRAVKN